MLYGEGPIWLARVERRLHWLAIPNIAGFLVGLQVIGFALVFSDARCWRHLALIPELVFQGELWRLITFLALPLSLNGRFGIVLVPDPAPRFISTSSLIATSHMRASSI
ncbi:MAG: hypothetical protein HYV04_19435 [Deltaproteobacteria bacterium]|nr:hypothetical protein [Deltaproteobacteria bacterium]